MKYLFTYILFFILYTGFATQQDSLKLKDDQTRLEQKQFDYERLDNYRGDNDFNYIVKERKPTFLERAWNWFLRWFQKFLAWLFGNKAAVGIMAFIVRVLPYLIGAVVLFLLLKFFLGLQSKSSQEMVQNKPTVHFTQEEALVKNKDLALLIEKAISQKNYRLAIRYYYLLSLQKLTKNSIIDWQQEKTNEDYIKEMTDLKLKEGFRANTYLYDFIWYGNFEIGELEFNKAAKAFNSFNALIE